MARRQLIFAARRAPFPFDNGARIRCHRLAAGLSEVFDVTFVTLAHGPAFEDGVVSADELSSVLPEARVEMLPGLNRRRRPGQARSLAGPASHEWGRYATRALRQRLAELVEGDPEAILHLDDLGTATAGVDLPARVVSYSSHNVEHRIVRGIAEANRGVHRAFLELEWRKVAREEGRVWRRADICLACSPVDAAVFRAGKARRVELCPNGADPVERRRPRPVPTGEALRMLFIGSGAYPPYEQGLRFFIEEVIPRVRDRMSLRLRIVGQPPWNPARAPEVEYCGRVDSVEPYYDWADAFIVPVFVGSGTRLKVIEAMAYGRPVVSTAIGVEGLPLAPDDHFWAAESPAEWERALLRLRDQLTSDAGAVDTVTAAARAAIEPLLWPRITADLAELYGRLAGGRA